MSKIANLMKEWEVSLLGLQRFLDAREPYFQMRNSVVPANAAARRQRSELAQAAKEAVLETEALLADRQASAPRAASPEVLLPDAWQALHASLFKPPAQDAKGVPTPLPKELVQWRDRVAGILHMPSGAKAARELWRDLPAPPESWSGGGSGASRSFIARRLYMALVIWKELGPAKRRMDGAMDDVRVAARESAKRYAERSKAFAARCNEVWPPLTGDLDQMTAFCKMVESGVKRHAAIGQKLKRLNMLRYGIDIPVISTLIATYVPWRARRLAAARERIRARMPSRERVAEYMAALESRSQSERDALLEQQIREFSEACLPLPVTEAVGKAFPGAFAVDGPRNGSAPGGPPPGEPT